MSQKNRLKGGNIDTLSTILISIAPSLSAIITVIAGVIKNSMMVKKVNENTEIIVTNATKKLEQAYKDIAVLKSKIASIEKIMIAEKETNK